MFALVLTLGLAVALTSALTVRLTLTLTVVLAFALVSALADTRDPVHAVFDLDTVCVVREAREAQVELLERF